MKTTSVHCLAVICLLLGCVAATGICLGQEAPEGGSAATDGALTETPEGGVEGSAAEDNLLEQTTERAGELAKTTQEKVDKLAEQFNEDERSRQVKDSLLKPIYLLAENLSFPAFHWVAFAAMSAGVVSFALQLVLGKLAVLARAGFSLMEILSDGLGLLISVIGLVLTTQAATENSSFTENPFAVVSAAGAGLLVGLVFYSTGKRQELQALEARKMAQEKPSRDDRRR